jgi:hypothetical protein
VIVGIDFGQKPHPRLFRDMELHDRLEVDFKLAAPAPEVVEASVMQQAFALFFGNQRHDVFLSIIDFWAAALRSSPWLRKKQ